MGVLSLRRQILMAQPHKDTVVGTNGIATFDTDFKAKIPKIVIPFTPAQDGTGDTSPDNVRPFSGWTGCEINLSGANVLFPPPIRRLNNCGPDENGKLTSSNYYHTLVMPIPKGLLYLYKQASGSELNVGFSNNPSLSIGDTTEDVLYTRWGTTYQYTNSSYRYAYVTIARSDSNPHFSIATTGYVRSRNYGKGTRIPITFTNPSTGDPMTIYGGTLTLNEDGSADLVQTYSQVYGRNYTWKKDRSGNAYYFYSDNTSWPSNANDRVTLLSDTYNGIPNIGYVDFKNNAPNFSCCFGSTTGYAYTYFMVKDLRYTTAADFANAVADVKFVAIRRTPVTYHFDNVGQLKAFLGTNNIWSDLNGDPTVTFWKHG